jgi:hypothetical protein
MKAPSLQIQQTALLDALLFNTPKSIALSADFIRAIGLKSTKNTVFLERGLGAYRAHAQAQSVAAMQACYPVLEQLLGDQNFAHLAQDFWQAMPPERGDVAQWGAALPEFLRSFPALQGLIAEHAYLPDVAQLEWALHLAATAPDTELDRASIALMTEHEPSALSLGLSGGCFLQASAFPTAAIVQLHRAQDAAVHAQAREAVQRGLDHSRSPEVFHALVWRRGLAPAVRPVEPAEAALIAALLAQQSLAAALDAAFAVDAQFDVSAWLQAQIQDPSRHGLMTGVVRLV